MILLYGGIVAGAHATAMVLVLADRGMSTSQRKLALALIATLPFVGIALAALACRVRGAGNSPALRQARRTRTRTRRERAALARDQAPLVERLMGAPAERRAALATLARSCDETSITAMRWLIERGHSEAVVEAALTLEDLHEHRMHAIDHARVELASHTKRSWRRALAGAELVAGTIHSGLADASMIPALSALARKLYEAAAQAAPAPVPEIFAGWAQLEIAAMQPQRALELLAHAGTPSTQALERRLSELQSDALFAARRVAQERCATARG